MSSPDETGDFVEANSCSACPSGLASYFPNDDTSCHKNCPATQVNNSDKAAINSLTGGINTSVLVTCDPGWFGTGATVCGKELQWKPIRNCSAKSCTSTQIANSDKSVANSITGTYIIRFFLIISRLL